jgi:phage baseplate assembly protein W
MINASEVVIDFSAGGNSEILQNIQVILTTPAGTVPFDRDFGIDMSILDSPIGVAKAKLTVEYIKKIKKYEPRAEVKKVSFTHDAISGLLVPKVVVGLAG